MCLLGLTAAQVGTNPVKYTIFGWDVSLPSGQVHAATTFAPAQITGPIDLTSQFNPSFAYVWQFIVCRRYHRQVGFPFFLSKPQHLR